MNDEEIMTIVKAQQLGIFRSDSTCSLQRNYEDAVKALKENGHAA